MPCVTLVLWFSFSVSCNVSNSFPAQPVPCQFAYVLHALGNLDAQSSAAGLHEGFAFCWWCHINCSLYTWKSVLGLLIKCCCPVLQTNSIQCVKNCYDSGDFLHQRYMLLNFGFSHLSLGGRSNYSPPQHHQFEKKRQNIVWHIHVTLITNSETREINWIQEKKHAFLGYTCKSRTHADCYLLIDPYFRSEICWWRLIVRRGLLLLLPLRLYVRLLKVLSGKQAMKKFIKADMTIAIFIQLLKQESQLLK